MSDTTDSLRLLWFGFPRSVDALNTLKRFDAASGAGAAGWSGSYNLPLTEAALGKASRQFQDLRLEREHCIAWLREIAADGLFNGVRSPLAPFGARLKAPQIPVSFRKICAAELLLAAQLSKHER